MCLFLKGWLKYPKPLRAIYNPSIIIGLQRMILFKQRSKLLAAQSPLSVQLSGKANNFEWFAGSIYMNPLGLFIFISMYI